MSNRWQLAALLLTSAIVAPHMALAQSAQNAANDFTVGWTCNSGTASFGRSNTGECLSLPTF